MSERMTTAEQFDLAMERARLRRELLLFQIERLESR